LYFSINSKLLKMMPLKSKGEKPPRSRLKIFKATKGKSLNEHKTSHLHTKTPRQTKEGSLMGKKQAY
jgi:hypothetical protein